MRKLFNLKNLILLTVFSLPLYLIKANFFGIPTNVLEILIIFVLLVFIKNKNKKNWQEEYYKHKKIIFFIFLIIIGFVASVLVNQNYRVGFGIVKGWLVFPLILAFLADIVFEKEEKKQIFTAYFYSVLVVSLVSLGYFIFGKTTYDGRLEAFFNSPNYLAMYLAPGFIIGALKLFLCFKEDRQSQKAKVKNQSCNLKVKKFYPVEFFIIGLAIYFTKSYAGWLALFLPLAFMFFAIRKKKLRLLIFFIVTISVVVLFQLRATKFNDLIKLSERSSLSSRIMIWQSAGKLLEENWFWGTGPGNFQERYLENQKYFSPYLEWAVPHPHNLYLNFWLSGGIIGFFGFLGLILLWFRNFWQRENKKEIAFLLVILLYILIHGFFDTTYFKNDLAVVFWLVILF